MKKFIKAYFKKIKDNFWYNFRYESDNPMNPDDDTGLDRYLAKKFGRKTMYI